MRYCDARHRRTADVVVGDQEGAGDLTQYADLMTDMRHVRAGGRLDFADDLELPHENRSTIRRVLGAKCPRPLGRGARRGSSQLKYTAPLLLGWAAQLFTLRYHRSTASRRQVVEAGIPIVVAVCTIRAGRGVPSDTGQIRVARVGAGQVGFGQVCVGQSGEGQVGVGQVDA